MSETIIIPSHIYFT